MPDILRAYTQRAADAAPGDPIRFVASTSDIARDGFIIDAAGWDLANFKRNPVVQWAHNYFEPPIGKVTHIEVKDDQLLADVVFDQNDEFARKIESKYRNGILNAVSVGFDIKQLEPAQGEQPMRATKTELLELSAVPVPADPGALAIRQQRGFRALGAELLKLADDPEGGDPDPDTPPDDPTVRLSWAETAAAMVGLYQPYSQRPDDERRAEHARLTRAYSRHKRTAPDFKTNAELEAFDADTLRGLFLEGEPALFPDRFAAMASRAGAVLSQRNLSDLAQAAELIQAVITRAKKDAETPDDDEAARAALRSLLERVPAKKD